MQEEETKKVSEDELAQWLEMTHEGSCCADEADERVQICTTKKGKTEQKTKEQ